MQMLTFLPCQGNGVFRKHQGVTKGILHRENLEEKLSFILPKGYSAELTGTGPTIIAEIDGTNIPKTDFESRGLFRNRR